jgi:predicted signal transduction protein with EAL and GGDEF domain
VGRIRPPDRRGGKRFGDSLADHAFIERIARVLQTSRLPTERVTIEVTESAAMHSPDRAIAALESWRSLGVNISIDDYGTGQSSLGYLQMLPATELKIDKSFVQSIGTDRRNAIMVRSTVALAHELGMKVVAKELRMRAAWSCCARWAATPRKATSSRARCPRARWRIISPTPPGWRPEGRQGHEPAAPLDQAFVASSPPALSSRAAAISPGSAFGS